MCLKKLKKNIERCQAQIAAIFDMPLSEQDPDVLAAFQHKLKLLLDERENHPTEEVSGNTTLHGTETSEADRPRRSLFHIGADFKERALQTNHCTIQQVERAKAQTPNHCRLC